jgi:alpha-methylacyl-CoA racemase
VSPPPDSLFVSWPLANLRVLDLSRLYPGPLCSLLLADLGAEVLKVEDPAGGDPVRWVPPTVNGMAGIFAALNRDKRSVALNLKLPAGAEALRRLARRADVLLESFRPGVMERLGLGYKALASENPGLIYCALTGYGQTGPYRDRAGHDLNYAGLAGVVALTGPRDKTPAVPGVQVADVGGALCAALRIVAAACARHRTGQGCFLDISMTESALSFLSLVAGKLAAGFTKATRGEDELAGGLPCYGVYGTADGKAMSLAALEPKFWQGFCAAVGRPDLATQGHLRGPEGDRVREEVAAIFRSRTRDEWAAFFAPLDVCCEPVLEPEEIESHPLFQARQAFLEVNGLRFLRTPVTPHAKAHLPAPALGAHTREVLSEAGYSLGEIEKLLAEGAAFAA